jgi:hypothetical protein
MRRLSHAGLMGRIGLEQGKIRGNWREMHWGIERIYAIHKILASGVMGPLSGMLLHEAWIGA